MLYIDQFDLHYMLKSIKILLEYEIEKGRALSMIVRVCSPIS